MPVLNSRRISGRFCALDADVTVESCDSVLFYIHKRYLETETDSFPPAEFSALGEVVVLSETSTTLEYMFQFIYPRHPNPDLDNLNINILAPLAEAVEKYQVYHAMRVCNVAMRKALPKHPHEVFSYAAKHDYPDLLDLAAPFLVGSSQAKLKQVITPCFRAPWVNYYDRWVNICQVALTYGLEPGYHRITRLESLSGGRISKVSHMVRCHTWGSICSDVVMRLGSNIGMLMQLDAIFSDGLGRKMGCMSCREDLASWRRRIEHNVLSMPKFSTFL